MSVSPPTIRALYGPFPHHILHEYRVTARWTWVNDNYGKDTANDTCNQSINKVTSIGGEDAFALSIGSSNIDIFNSSLRVCGNGTYWGNTELFKNSGKECHTYTQLSDSSQYGIGFREQDKDIEVQEGCAQPWGVCRYWDDNMYSGVLRTTITAKKGCSPGVQAFTKYAHSWRSTSINSMGIGADSIAVGWEHEGHGWPLASPGSNPRRICH